MYYFLIKFSQENTVCKSSSVLITLMSFVLVITSFITLIKHWDKGIYLKEGMYCRLYLTGFHRDVIKLELRSHLRPRVTHATVDSVWGKTVLIGSWTVWFCNEFYSPACLVPTNAFEFITLCFSQWYMYTVLVLFHSLLFFFSWKEQYIIDGNSFIHPWKDYIYLP